MKNIKAQIKMIENVGVLVIFFVLVVLALIFYFTYQRGAIEEATSELKVRNALELSGKVSSLPELQCRKNNVVEDHCFDILKTDSARLLLSAPEKEDYYFRLLGFSTIRVSSIYPKVYNTQIYDKEMPTFTNNDTFSIPVSLYDPVSNSYDYGILQVSAYS